MVNSVGDVFSRPAPWSLEIAAKRTTEEQAGIVRKRRYNDIGSDKLSAGCGVLSLAEAKRMDEWD